MALETERCPSRTTGATTKSKDESLRTNSTSSASEALSANGIESIRRELRHIAGHAQFVSAALRARYEQGVR